MKGKNNLGATEGQGKNETISVRNKSGKQTQENGFEWFGEATKTDSHGELYLFR